MSDNNDKKSGARSWLSEVFHDSDVKGMAKFCAFFLIIGGTLATCSVMDTASTNFKNRDKVTGNVPDCIKTQTSNVVVNGQAYTLNCR